VSATDVNPKKAARTKEARVRDGQRFVHSAARVGTAVGLDFEPDVGIEFGRQSRSAPDKSNRNGEENKKKSSAAKQQMNQKPQRRTAEISLASARRIAPASFA
jgi:hypothetical protein